MSTSRDSGTTVGAMEAWVNRHLRRGQEPLVDWTVTARWSELVAFAKQQDAERAELAERCAALVTALRPFANMPLSSEAPGQFSDNDGTDEYIAAARDAIRRAQGEG